MSERKEITLDIRIDLCKRLVKTRKHKFVINDLRKLLCKKFRINISEHETRKVFEEMLTLSDQTNISEFIIKECLRSYEIIKSTTITDELKFTFYKQTYLTYKGGIVEVMLAKLLESKFPQYKQCSRSMIYKYIFSEYCKYKPSTKTYSQSFDFSIQESQKYLEYAIDEIERKLCNIT